MEANKMMNEAEICEADSKLQRDYKKGIISKAEWDFSRKVLHEEWKSAVKEKELLDNLMKKYQSH